MNADVLVLGVIGGLAGLASGRLAVALERTEKLREEEDEDREAYGREMDELIAAAATEGATPPVKEPWEHEHYGWSWLEWGLSPVLGAVSFAWFAQVADDHGAAVAAGTVHRLLAIHLVWLALFVHIVAFDIKHRLILNRVTYPSIALALVLSAFTPGVGLVPAAVGALAVYLLFLAQNLALGSRVIGRGDAKLGAILGGVTGLSFGSPVQLDALWAVMAAFILGGFGAVGVLLFRSVRAALRARRAVQVPALFFRQLRRSMKEPIPYGPFLCAGAALVLLHNLG